MNNNGYCHLSYKGKGSKSAKVLAFLFTHGLIYLFVAIITLAAYIRGRRIYGALSHLNITSYNVYSRSLLLYPLAQLIMYTPSTVTLFIEIWNEVPLGWHVFTLTCTNLIGLANIIIYGSQYLINRKQEKERTSLKEYAEKLDFEQTERNNSINSRTCSSIDMTSSFQS